MTLDKDQRFLRAVLWAPAKLYELAVRLRIVAYEADYLKQRRLNATVISIGNITVGGTGKTPLVEYIASYLKREDHRVAILTRGYGRDSSERRILNDTKISSSERSSSALGSTVEASNQHNGFTEFGDEPVMLARALPQIPIIVDKDRYEAGLIAEREFGADVLILDDAYQHLRLARDLNLLLIDATDPFGGFEMVPFGRLREPLYALKRADAVIITRADKPFDQAETLGLIKEICGEQTPVIYLWSAITELIHLQTGIAYDIKGFTGWNVAAFCGIANPNAFADDLLQIGMNIVSENFYPDHHAFAREDIAEVIQCARGGAADAIVTTQKDAVRLEGCEFGEIPVYAARSQVRGDDEVRLRSLLLRTVLQQR